jgi:hypothetical protein
MIRIIIMAFRDVLFSLLIPFIFILINSSRIQNKLAFFVIGAFVSLGSITFVIKAHFTLLNLINVYRSVSKNILTSQSFEIAFTVIDLFVCIISMVLLERFFKRNIPSDITSSRQN